MTYKDNTPTFNVNRKVVNFKDFSANPNAEKEELKKMDRQNKPNTDDQQKNMANSRYKFNNTTRKMDDLSPAEIEDKIEAIEDFEETNVIKEKYDETLNTLWNDIQKPIKNYIDPIGRPSIESDDSKVIEVIDVLEDIMKDLKQRLKPTKKWFK